MVIFINNNPIFFWRSQIFLSTEPDQISPAPPVSVLSSREQQVRKVLEENKQFSADRMRRWREGGREVVTTNKTT